jgi:ketosteroid isomerase-like protein
MAAAQPDDVAGVKAWFEALAAHVREVDFVGARPIFALDMIAFGTFTDFMTGRDVAEQQQWRNVWPHIDGFRWRADIKAIVSPDRLQAVGMGVFVSTGYQQDGTAYDRPGRATVVFVRRVSTRRGLRSTRICRCSATCRRGASSRSRRSTEHTIACGVGALQTR